VYQNLFFIVGKKNMSEGIVRGVCGLLPPGSRRGEMKSMTSIVNIWGKDGFQYMIKIYFLFEGLSLTTWLDVIMPWLWYQKLRGKLLGRLQFLFIFSSSALKSQQS